MTTLTQLEQNNGILLDDLSMTDQTRLFFTNLLLVIDEQSIAYGTGNPEGVVSAIKGKTYQDNSGTASAIRYAKSVDDVGGDTAQGWILI